MGRTTRHSRRQGKKDRRKAERKKAKKDGNGRKAGSIAIHSLLPGLEGAQMGEMEVVVDARRKDQHPALINVAIHQKQQQRAVIWQIETGFGGLAPRVGCQVIPDGQLDNAPPIAWFPEVASAEAPNETDVTAEADNDDDQADTAEEPAA